jgi:hypothetical protein
MYVNIKSSQQPNNLDNEFNWEEELSKQKEEQLYKVVPELWPIRKVVPKELHFLLEIDCGMIQTKEKIDYPFHFSNMNQEKH